MKVLIAYSSKYGTVTECVRRLQNALHKLPSDAIDLEKETPVLSNYDIVIIGTSVRFGKPLPAVRAFLAAHEAELLQKELAFFFCCGLAHEHDYYAEKLFPAALREHAMGIFYFGGVLKVEKPSLVDRFLYHSMRSSILESEIEDGEYTPSLPGILPETIEKLATYVRDVINRQKE